MRVWHDDARPAPDGWVWARTNGQAKYLLMTHEVTEISLDNDLGAENEGLPEDVDALIDTLQNRKRTAEEGIELVRWMIERRLVPEKVTIHSWNQERAREMALTLNDHGYDCVVEPYKP